MKRLRRRRPADSPPRGRSGEAARWSSSDRVGNLPGSTPGGSRNSVGISARGRRGLLVPGFPVRSKDPVVVAAHGTNLARRNDRRARHDVYLEVLAQPPLASPRIRARVGGHEDRMRRPAEGSLPPRPRDARRACRRAIPGDRRAPRAGRLFGSRFRAVCRQVQRGERPARNARLPQRVRDCRVLEGRG